MVSISYNVLILYDIHVTILIRIYFSDISDNQMSTNSNTSVINNSALHTENENLHIYGTF